MSPIHGKSSWLFVSLVALAACHSSSTVVEVEYENVELCEIEVADSHFPRVNFFHQHIESSGARIYSCTLLVGPVEAFEANMRAELEPWCRGKIESPMTASSRCYKTHFERPALEVRLSESFEGEEGEEGEGAVYMLEGQVMSYRNDS